MKNEMVLENYSVNEMQSEEKVNVDGGGLLKKIIKFTDNGTLLDGIKGNTNIDCYIFCKKIF